jgi:hypothetical protein
MDDVWGGVSIGELKKMTGVSANSVLEAVPEYCGNARPTFLVFPTSVPVSHNLLSFTKIHFISRKPTKFSRNLHY